MRAGARGGLKRLADQRFEAISGAEGSHRPLPPRPEGPTTARLATEDHLIPMILAQQARQHGR